MGYNGVSCDVAVEASVLVNLRKPKDRMTMEVGYQTSRVVRPPTEPNDCPPSTLLSVICYRGGGVG